MQSAFATFGMRFIILAGCENVHVQPTDCSVVRGCKPKGI